MLVIFAATREDEYAKAIHVLHPIGCGIEIIIQGEDPHFDVVEIGASAEHLGITVLSQGRCGQFRRLDEGSAIGKHRLITLSRQCHGGQFRRFDQVPAAREHAEITTLSQFHRRQFRRMRQARTFLEHREIASFLQFGHGQCRGLRQSRGEEHIHITIIRQFGCRKLWRMRHALAKGEHVGIA